MRYLMEINLETKKWNFSLKCEKYKMYESETRPEYKETDGDSPV